MTNAPRFSKGGTIYISNMFCKKKQIPPLRRIIPEANDPAPVGMTGYGGSRVAPRDAMPLPAGEL
jgi:hypothetical protein